MKKVVLLPSASLVPIGLQAEFGAIPSAMIPLDGRPSLKYVAERYLREGYEIVVAVHESAHQVRDFIQSDPDTAAQIIDVGPTTSLGGTIAAALGSMDAPPDQLIINFADTVVEDELAEKDIVCYAEMKNTFRWTTFRLDTNHRITDIVEKNLHKDDSEAHPVFIGVFSMADPEKFRSCLARSLNAADQQIDPFYAAVAGYFNDIPSDQKRFLLTNRWWDFGHLDTYYETRRKRFGKERFFNRVTVDDNRGVLRKESDDAGVLRDEIRWYLNLPKPLQYLSPRIFDYDSDAATPFIEMEFYGYPVLTDAYLFGAWDAGTWAFVFQRLRSLLETFGRFGPVALESAQIRAAMREMYEEKTEARVASLLHDRRFERFMAPRIWINGVECLGLPEMLTELPGLISRVGLYDRDSFSVVHGDLCFSNILYDPRTRILRLIDPRGRFGAYDVYGDPRYDAAKLRHSIEGDYDFYVNGLFTLNWRDADHVEFHANLADRHQLIKRIYRSQFYSKEPCGSDVRLIESLLFISMVPLHEDRLSVQEVLLAKGLLSFAEVARGL